MCNVCSYFTLGMLENGIKYGILGIHGQEETRKAEEIFQNFPATLQQNYGRYADKISFLIFVDSCF